MQHLLGGGGGRGRGRGGGRNDPKNGTGKVVAKNTLEEEHVCGEEPLEER